MVRPSPTAVPAAALLLAFAVAAAASPAVAQDRDPFEAALQAQAVRERQAQSMHRAETRVLTPLANDSLPGPNPPPKGKPIEIPQQRERGEGSMPWLLPVVAGVVAISVYSIWRAGRSGRDGRSNLPGHQGFRRDR